MEGPTLGKREERQKGRGTPSNLRICSRMRVRPGRLRHPRASFSPPFLTLPGLSSQCMSGSVKIAEKLASSLATWPSGAAGAVPLTTLLLVVSTGVWLLKRKSWSWVLTTLIKIL